MCVCVWSLKIQLKGKTKNLKLTIYSLNDMFPLNSLIRYYEIVSDIITECDNVNVNLHRNGH